MNTPATKHVPRKSNPNPDAEKYRLQVWLEADLYNTLAEFCEEQGMTMTGFTRQLIKKAIGYTKPVAATGEQQ